MKIGINATILDSKPSGLGIYTINIIKELAQLLNEEDSIVVYTSEDKIFLEDKVEVVIVNKYVSPRYGKFGGAVRFLWNQFIFPLKVKRDKIDIIYSSTHHGSLFTKKSQFITIHDILAIIFPKQHILQNFYFKYLNPRLLTKMRGVVTVSNNTKNDLIREYQTNPSNIKVVYNSYDKNHFKEKKSLVFKEKYGDYFLFVGATYPHKNLPLAIDAFLGLQKTDENKNLVIVGGKRGYRDDVINNYKDRGVSLRNIHFIDYVPYDDLPKLYSSAIALVYPSLYEGFGIPPIEAMACGCPVIASNASSIPEVCSDAALYIDPKSVDSLMEAMIEIQVPIQRNKQIQLGYKNIERFSWKKSAEDLLTFLKETQKY